MIGARDRAQVERGAALMLAVAAVLALFWPAAVSLATLWADSERRTYTHGYLIVAVSLWLLWRNRGLANRPDTERFAWPLTLVSFAMLAATALLWQVSYRAGLTLATEALLLPLLWLTILTTIGWNAARAALLPVAYLVFALTVWDYVNPAAQSLSVHAVRFLLRAVDVPAYFAGNSVQIPSGHFEIAEGCSGLHFIIVALALAVLLGEIRGDHWRLRLRWCLLALALALISNWLRIFIIILAGHVSHMQHYLVRESHYGFGWVVFGLVLAVLFVIERRTPERHHPPAHQAAATGGGPLHLPRWIACVLVLAIPFIENKIVETRLAATHGTGLSQRLASAALQRGWIGEAAGPSAWQPAQNAADIKEQRRYRRSDATVETFLAQYREQRNGKKLGGYANRLQGDAAVLEESRETIAGRTFATRLLEQNGQQSLIWFKYRADGRDFTSAARAQLWYSWETVRRARSVPSEAFAAWAPCEPDCNAARSALISFITDIEDVM
jgi:exosortase